jgi:hypothetical protein
MSSLSSWFSNGFISLNKSPLVKLVDFLLGGSFISRPYINACSFSSLVIA